MCEKVITATSPCMKFVDCSISEQLQKLYEEVKEVDKEIQKLNGCKFWREVAESDNNIFSPTEKCFDRVLLHLMIEMFDVQTCINTMFEQIKKETKNYEAIRAEAERAVVEKNKARGYYEVQNENI